MLKRCLSILLLGVVVLSGSGWADAHSARISFSIHGVRTFNGDGTGQAVARVVGTSHPFALPPSGPNPAFFNRGGANSSDIQATFTYDVEPDRTVTINQVTTTGTILTGPEAGQTFAITNLPAFVGKISHDAHSLTLAHEDPGVETVTFSDGDVQYRLCHRTRILLEQKKHHD